MRFRRHDGPPLLQTVRGRRLVRNVLIILAACLAGYLVSFRLYPAPLFTRDHSVPRVLDVGITEAQQRVAASGFRIRIAPEEPDPRAAKGKVVWQDPPPGTIAPEGATVTLTPSAGPTTILVPDVINFEAEDAGRVIQAAGLSLGAEDSVASGVDPGVVVATRPAPGVSRPSGTPVDLVLSSGPPPSGVPSVLGMTVEDARRVLARVGLSVGGLRAQKGDGPPGVVLEQNPGSGSRVLHGGRVDLVVSAREDS